MTLLSKGKGKTLATIIRPTNSIVRKRHRTLTSPGWGYSDIFVNWGLIFFFFFWGGGRGGGKKNINLGLRGKLKIQIFLRVC